jgi:hypothetical protein
MHFPLALMAFVWAVVAYIIYAIISSVLLSRANAAKARQLKCEEPVWEKNVWPLGLDKLYGALNADKLQIFPTFTMKRVGDVGSVTFKYHVLGTAQIATQDEKNIQAILATQFADFDLGPVRRGNFFPLLGNGIFTQDGKGWEHSRTMMRPQFARGTQGLS